MENEPVNYPKAPASKPWRVTAYRTALSLSFLVGDYRWYWQANLVSWWYHHILGYGVNTWRKIPEEVNNSGESEFDT